MEDILLKSSQNISDLIKVIRLHEENISRFTPRLQEDTINTGMYYECEYGSILYPEHLTCPITREYFKPNDQVVIVYDCKHTFKKEAFMDWIKNNNHCPRCKTLL
jgi:hypothetical protein